MEQTQSTNDELDSKLDEGLGCSFFRARCTVGQATTDAGQTGHGLRVGEYKKQMCVGVQDDIHRIISTAPKTTHPPHLLTAHAIAAVQLMS